MLLALILLALLVLIEAGRHYARYRRLPKVIAPCEGLVVRTFFGPEYRLTGRQLDGIDRTTVRGWWGVNSRGRKGYLGDVRGWRTTRYIDPKLPPRP